METVILHAISTPAIWVALALQLADVVTTIIVLRGPGGYESNPIVAAAVEGLGYLWPVLKVVVVMSALVYDVTQPGIPLIWPLNAVMLWVVWHNIGVIRDQRRKG